MITEQFEMIDSILGNRQLTINQLSKNIKKSYAFTNKYVHDLIDKKILQAAQIGPSIVCSLNFENKHTIACLIYNSILKAKGISRDTDKVLFSYGKKEYIVSKTTKGGYKKISGEEFSSMIDTMDLSKVKVIGSHEKFWRLVAAST